MLKMLTSTLAIAAILNGNSLGTTWSCGMTGNGILLSARVDAAINSEKYDWAFEFENAKSYV